MYRETDIVRIERSHKLHGTIMRYVIEKYRITIVEFLRLSVIKILFICSDHTFYTFEKVL